MWGKWSVNKFFLFTSPMTILVIGKKNRGEKKWKIFAKGFLSSTNEQKQLSLGRRHSGKTIKVNCWNFHCHLNLL
jgi:hypothetical protein